MTKIAAKEREKQKIGMVRSCYYRGAIVVYYLMGWMYEPRDWERRRTRGTLYVLSRSFQYREPCNYHLAAISLSVVYQSISRYQESSRRLVLNSWGGPSILFIEIKTKKKKNQRAHSHLLSAPVVFLRLLFHLFWSKHDRWLINLSLFKKRFIHPIEIYRHLKSPNNLW